MLCELCPLGAKRAPSMMLSMVSLASAGHWLAGLYVLLALLLLAGVQPLAAQRLDPGPASGSPDQEYAPGQLLVRFRTPATGRRAVEMLAAQGID